jgi:hypothetical protein
MMAGAGGSMSVEYNSDKLANMIIMRLRPDPGMKLAEFLAAHIARDRVHVFVVTNNGEAAHIEDEWNMVPSDALITKLRLIM